MSGWQRATLSCVLLLAARSNAGAAQNALAGSLQASAGSMAMQQNESAPPAPDVREARIALGFDPFKRCPDLRHASADEPTVAVVDFLVGPSGVPSRATITSSSGDETLDTAAVSCVLKLRFQPAIRAGDGNPVDSWQQIAWKRARAQRHEPPAMTQGSNSQVMPDAGAGTAATDTDGSERSNGSRARQQGAAVAVHVCVDDTGKVAQDPTIIRSSGDPKLDEAAVKIARSGAGYYRPATTLDAEAVSGCVQLQIKFERK
jgi:TonB family protein